jgi:mono/diheme cytochrome c family protein
VKRFCYICASAVLSMMMLSSCSTLSGKPKQGSETVAPDQVLDFNTLYAENCAGCHGAQGRGGAAIALADPVYLAITDESQMRNVTSNGTRGTSMPAFAQSAGGMLTDKQIDAITSGIFSHWARKGVLDGTNPPSYTAKTKGDAANGLVVYGAHCAPCHGAEGQGGPKGSSVTNGSFLALVSDQGLRTIVITGRPELGMPDWRGKGNPMTDQQVTDVVAWLASRRVQNPGQPYSASNSAPRKESIYGR